MRRFHFLFDPLDGGAFVLLILLYLLGARLVQASPQFQKLGKQVAFGSFLLFVVIAADKWNPGTAWDWAAIVFRSLVFAGIVLGITWTLLPALGFAYMHTFGACFRSMKDFSETLSQRQSEARREYERRMREAQWERSRPQREREAQERAIRLAAESQKRAAAEKRRNDVRAECDALYALAAPEIGSRFSKQDFMEFVSKHMADSAAPEVVEERGEQLKGIIRHHWERIEPPRQNLKELSDWFEQRMSELQSVSDERLRKSLSVQLKVRYSELISTMLSEMSP